MSANDGFTTTSSDDDENKVEVNVDYAQSNHGGTDVVKMQKDMMQKFADARDYPLRVWG